MLFAERGERLSQPVRTDLSEVIAENFGANATYVEGLLSRFRSNPELVDESWRAYFAELLGDGDGSGTAPTEQREVRAAENGGGTAAHTPTAEAVAPAKAEAPAAPPKKTVSAATSRYRSHSRRRTQNRREHGSESVGSDRNFAATHSREAAGREPAYHQQVSCRKMIAAKLPIRT